MNLVLIGYRGTGKSSLSRLLGRQWGWPVYHCDQMLEQRLGESIAQFVERQGWPAFRDAEATLIQELAHHDRAIIDTGGGVVERKENGQTLRGNGFVVWLQSSPESIAYWIGGDAKRPSLTGTQSAVDEIHEVLARRTPLYAEASHYTVCTDVQSLQESVQEIEQAFARFKNKQPPSL